LSIGVFVAVVSKLVNIILKQKRYIAVKRKRFATSHGLRHGLRHKSKHVTDKAKKPDID